MPDLIFTSKGAAEAIRKQEQLNEKARDLKQIYRQDAEAAKELERAAGRIFANAKNPADQYNKEMGKLLKGFRDGKLSAEQYEKGVSKLKDAFDDVSTLSGQLQQRTSKIFSSDTLVSIGKFALGLGGVSTAAAAITNELRSSLELIDKAAATQLSVSASRNTVIRNLVGTDPDEIKRILKENQDLAGEVGISEQAINQARADALSASGGNVAASLEATKLAAQYLADRPTEIGGFAGSLLDLSKVTGSTDAAQNLGLLAFVASASRVTAPQQQAANIPRALIGAKSYGATQQEAAALFAAITTGSGDLTGASSGTATIQLARQLEEFNPEELAGLKTTGERIAALQANPALAKTFLDDAAFEATSAGPIRELLTNQQSEIAQAYAAGLASLPDAAGLAQRGRGAIDAFGLANELEPLATATRSLGALAEQLRAGSTQNLGEEARAYLTETLQRTGGTNLGSRGRTLLASLKDGELGISVEEARDVLAGEAARLGRPTRLKNLGSGGIGGPGSFVEVKAPKEEIEQAKLLQQVVQILTDSLEAAKEGNRKLDDTGLTAGAE